ncbi:hypothetical protein Leryth_024325 [Lithospermum erythrorhizon]|nr:hypothetical protein Leryth_024325 [Lithospermum erythrorhizon]
MANSLNLATLVTLAIASLLGHTTAETYIVGGAGGWTFTQNATLYPSFAAQYNFTVGDVLVFNFPTSLHTVATVTRESYDACNFTNPITLIDVGPANVTLNATGEIYFVCTIGQHCAAGLQKLAINVSASSTISPSSPPPASGEGDAPPPPPASGSADAPPPAPLSGGNPPSPPPTSASSRTGIVSIFTIFISLAIYILF